MLRHVVLFRRKADVAPQPELERALVHAGGHVTDEASAIEKLGHAPKLVPGEFENLKITWPADFALAARLLETR